MLRVLFSVLAVVVAVLAIVMEDAFLYAAAAVLLLIVLILGLGMMRRRHREAQRLFVPPPPPPPPTTDDLQSLGIMDIRPKSASRSKAQEPTADAVPAARRPGAARPKPDAPPAVRPKKVYHPLPDEPAEAPPEDADVFPATVLRPALEALRAALDAQTVCLLRQAGLAPHYDVIARAGAPGEAAAPASFTTRAPLLPANGHHPAVAVRHLGTDGLTTADLGYRADADAVGTVALAAVPLPAEDAYLLLADAAGDHLEAARVPMLMDAFAGLLGTLLRDAARRADEATRRPRREIIAEAMDQARARQQGLAFALIYLNRAEAVAALGQDAVAEAERLMYDRLLAATPHGRVTQFGELTYGVFTQDDAAVEAWSARVQHAFATESGLLEGGVSVGIALLQDRHTTPDDFRDDTTEALRVAFESGTYTILE